MEPSINQAIDDLEKQLLSDPDSPSLYDLLLWKYFAEESLHGHPGRINHILVCIRRFPRNEMCQSPLVIVDPGISPDGYKKVEREWIRLINEHPKDEKIAIGAANFYCTKDLNQSIEILKNNLEHHPDQADVCLHLGRYITSNPKERLHYFKEAQRLGAEQPNLLVWLGRSAVDACEFNVAESYGKELLELAACARNKYGNKLDWKEKGKSLFSKALDSTGNKSTARKLVREISNHAYHKHWGHTVLGHVALSHDDLKAALSHLRESAAVVGDHRLSSFGPSMDLAKALCVKGEWSYVADYLKNCTTFWDDERLPVWISMVESKRLPDF